MDDKDRAAAYKALIAWFDSQDIGTEDAANIMLVLLADMIWQSTNHTAAEAAVLADNLHLQITRQLGLHLAQDLEKFFGKDKDQ